MKNKELLVSIFMLACALLSGCASAATAAPATAAAPVAASSTPAAAATIEPAATAGTPTSTRFEPTATSGLHFDGLSSGLDNTTQARIRTVDQIMEIPGTDVYINGMQAFNGGIAQRNVTAGLFSGWLYVTPGTYTVALVPHGKALAQALFPPAAVKVEAGHRYTVAAIGQLMDKNVHALVVDETALVAALHPSPTDNISIDINNLKGADSITEECDNKKAAENIKYGEARAYLCPSGTISFKTTGNAKTPGEIYSGTSQAEPQASFTLPYYGPFPAPNYDAIGNTSQGTSEVNVLDFLAGFKGRDVNISGHTVTFNTLLSAIDKAGLRDTYTKNGPYFFLAPTDEAFASLSQADRDALFKDPQALLKLLQAHIIDGYYPAGSLSGAVYQHSDRTLTNELGQSLVFKEEMLNGLDLGPSYTVGNGNRVVIMYSLLPVK